MIGITDRQHLVERNTSYHRLYILWGVLPFLFLLFFARPVSAQQDGYVEEIIVSVSVQGMGVTDMPAIIDGDSTLLPVSELFDYLRIKNESTPGFDTISGFFITEDARYIFDNKNSLVVFSGKTYQLTPRQLVNTETGIYINTKYLGEIFGLDTRFNFRALLISIVPKMELPVVREARLVTMRNNINRLKGNLVADTTLPRSKQFFRLGMVDWSVISSQQFRNDGNLQKENRLSMGIGAMLVGGELNANLNYSPEQDFDNKRQYYMWRKVNNESKIVRQVSVGKISTPTTASVFAPIIGAQITNKSTTYRQAFGYYTLTDITEPNWTVELYVNNALVDYATADAGGFFTFQVPLVYGSSSVKLKFYGPFGEVRTKEENISVPYTFLPPGELEYTASAGLVEDDSATQFSKAAFGYGVSKKLTIGAGTEYLTSVRSGNTMPYVTATTRVGTSLLLNGEYTHTVRSRAGISYRFPSNLVFDALFTKYADGQKAVNTGATEERKLSVSTPVKGLRFTAFTMLTVNQIVLPVTKYTNAEWLISGVILGVGTNISTYGVFVDRSDPFVYSNFSFAFRLPRAYTLNTQFQYEYTHGQFISARALVEKRLFGRAYFNLSYEKNFKSNLNNLGLQLRYDLSFTQIGATAFYSNKNVSLLQSARGSIMIDDHNGYVKTRNNVNVGKGGLVLSPFLDMNCNGKHDPGEPKVSGLKFRINVGRVQPEDKDTTIRVFDMEPYSKCYIELNRFSFDNIAWQIRNKTISLMVEPNVFTRIDIPVAVVAEASGMVYINRSNVKRGQGQIYVCFYRNDSLVAKILTEPDGYFSYIGLSPGTYTAVIDSQQMKKVNMKASEPLIFNVLSNKDGDIIEGLDFTLELLNKEVPKKNEDE
jgi:hypothetical protein